MSRTKELFQELRYEYFRDQLMVENGEISELDFAIKIREEMELSKDLDDSKKNYLNEIRSVIEDQSEQYGKDGYKGFLISVRPKPTYDFKGIESIDKVESDLKELKEKYKRAYIADTKGEALIDPDTGEVYKLPKLNTTYSLTFNKTKK